MKQIDEQVKISLINDHEQANELIQSVMPDLLGRLNSHLATKETPIKFHFFLFEPDKEKRPPLWQAIASNMSNEQQLMVLEELLRVVKERNAAGGDV